MQYAENTIDPYTKKGVNFLLSKYSVPHKHIRLPDGSESYIILEPDLYLNVVQIGEFGVTIDESQKNIIQDLDLPEFIKQRISYFDIK